MRRIPEGDNGEDGLVHLVVLDGLSRRLGGGRGEESPGSGGTLPGPVEGISGRLGCHSDGDMDRY